MLGNYEYGEAASVFRHSLLISYFVVVGLPVSSLFTYDSF